MIQASSKPLKLEKLSKILFTLTLKSGKNYAWKPLKVAIFCRKRPWKPWNRYEKMARHPVWNFIPSLIFRSLALSYRLGNKRGENVRKLGQNMSGNCQECQEFSTLQRSGHFESVRISAGLIKNRQRSLTQQEYQRRTCSDTPGGWHEAKLSRNISRNQKL